MKILANNFLRITIVDTMILFCIGLSSIIISELEIYFDALIGGHLYIGPYLDEIWIGAYGVLFFITLLVYLIPCTIGVSIVMTNSSVYSSKVKRGFIGLIIGLIGAIVFFFLEFYISFGQANNLSEIFELLFIPFSFTIVSVILFIIIPSVVRVSKNMDGK